MQISQETMVILWQMENVCKNRMDAERSRVELSEDLEGADDVGNIYKDAAGPTAFTALNTTAILLSLNSDDTSACFHNDIFTACFSIRGVVIVRKTWIHKINKQIISRDSMQHI